MSKSYRIRTTPGQENNGYVQVNVDLNQNYDQLEILSLKISQKDDYQNFCADYGVVAGRVIVNNGFGVPNVKVSVFVPVEDGDLTDPVKSAIYPYTEPFPDQKNKNGVRYNLLPKNQQSFDHTPVGTFPKKREVLDDNTTLEIYEKYYKYTTVTNEAGDYILFGIPVGDHFLHYDMDVSDIGFISIRPFEMIDKDGYSDDLFDSRFKYKGSNNLDSLPQIFSENIPITVEPYWCDSLSVGSGLGINRYDIEPNISITPTAIFMGSIFSDDEKDSLNKNCKPSREMGKLNEVITGPGKIEAIRRTVDGNIETFEFNDNSIDDNGNWSVLVPMNIRKVVTDEFGNLVPSPDGIKGIATEGDYRFRVSMDATSNDKRLRQRAKYLVPNTNNNFSFGEFSTKQLKKDRPFTKNTQLSQTTLGTQYEDDITNQYNYLEEFFPFRWKKVYTVKQYIGRMQKTPIAFDQKDESRGFIGIKDIINAEGVNKFPTNRTDTTINPIYSIICILVVLFGHVVGFINGIIQFINGLITLICNIKIPTGICSSSSKGVHVDILYYMQKGTGDFLNNGADWSDGDWNNRYNYGTQNSEFLDMDYISEGDFDLDDTGLSLNCNEIDQYFYLSEDGTIGPNSFGNSFTSLNGWAEFNSADKSANGQTTANPIGRYPNSGGGPGTGSSQYPQCGSGENCFCPNGPPTSGKWCYNYGSCYYETCTNCGACKRWQFRNGAMGNSLDDCNKRVDPTLKQQCKDDPDALYLLGRCWRLKKKCLFSASLCNNCKDICDPNDEFNCCGNNDCIENPSICGGPEGGCCNGRCCSRIGLIPLKCADEGVDLKISLINLQGFSPACNRTFVKPFACLNCGGRQTPGIKDWASCLLEPVAVFLRMLKFDFYNDWVGGTLYFPLIKRKYKLKKSKRKFGQIKKDKFCDFECKERIGFENNQLGIPIPIFSNNFQGNPTFKQHRIRIKTLGNPAFPTITIGGCTARVLLKRATDWYGTPENDAEIPNLNLAVQEFKFNGRDSNNEKCSIIFNNFSEFQNVMNAQGVDFDTPEREIQTEHGKPEYIQTEDSNGTSTWKNIGGHAHHRNICDETKMVERKEYFKTSLDCLESGCEGAQGDYNDDDNPLGGFGQESGDDDQKCWTPFQPAESNQLAGGEDYCELVSCNPDCGSNGIAPCIKNNTDEYTQYSAIIKHGLISWEEGEIYYTPYIPPQDVKYNNVEYKANLMLPTTIMELGSSVYCDIDDIPFIMDVLPPTTFNASYEDLKYRFGQTDPNYSGPDGNAGTTEDNGIFKPITKFDDKKDVSLNLRAYVEFACFKVICENIMAPVVQSQIGVDIIDKNDIGIEIGNCFVRFDHDDEVRNYFCRRFNGYKGGDLSFHHQRPGSVQYENEYNTYQDITLTDGVNIYYQLPDGDIVKSEYNDNDSFTPGDGCGYRNTNGPTDFFYGAAPGQTSSFINYPNADTSFGDNGTINFGQTAQLDGTDEIFIGVANSGGDISLEDDPNNGSTQINGIRFNRSQTPYYLYFGLVPGKTALHKTVGKFFADRINAVTLEGLGASPDSVEENINNTPNINNVQDNTFSVFRTCLGETLIQPISVGDVQQNTNTTGGGSQGNNNTSGGSGGSGSNSGSGGTGGNPSGPGATTPYVQPNLGPFLGGNPQTGGSSSSGTGSSTPDFNLVDSFGNTFSGPVTITSAPCTVNGEVTETRNFTIELNSGTATINVNMYGGATYNLCPSPPITNGTAFNVKINDGNGGPINQTVVSETVPIYNNSTQSYTINNIGTYEVQVEVIPFFTNDGFEISVSVS